MTFPLIAIKTILFTSVALVRQAHDLQCPPMKFFVRLKTRFSRTRLSARKKSFFKPCVILKKLSKVTMSDKSDAIGVLHKSGKTASEIFKILKPSVSRSGVYKVIKRFRMTGSYSPRVRGTPP